MENLQSTLRQYSKTPRTIDAHLKKSMPGAVSGTGWAITVLGAIFTLGLWFSSGFAGAILGIVLMMVGLGVGLSQGRKAQEQTKRMLEQGPLVLMSVIHANQKLYQNPPLSSMALVVFSVDPERKTDEEWLENITKQIHDLKGRELPSEEVRLLWEMMNNDFSSGTIKLPVAFTGNESTYMRDLFVDASLLPQEGLEPGVFVCIVDPEDHNTFVQV